MYTLVYDGYLYYLVMGRAFSQSHLRICDITENSFLVGKVRMDSSRYRELMKYLRVIIVIDSFEDLKYKMAEEFI